jgi:DNA-binding GntR family transcriptional regulator
MGMENEMKAEKKIYRVKRANLNQQIYGILKEMIADQRFNPGSYINVEQLCQELEVSRTPIWEAIRRLEQEGIVTHTPHKGVCIRELTKDMALELYKVREALENLAARSGAPKATPEIIDKMESLLVEQEKTIEQDDPVAYSRADYEFHLLIYEACGNTLLKEILEGLRYKALPLAFRLMPYLDKFLEFHQELLKAFRAKDGQSAEDVMRRHNQQMVEIIHATEWGQDKMTT